MGVNNLVDIPQGRVLEVHAKPHWNATSLFIMLSSPSCVPLFLPSAMKVEAHYSTDTTVCYLKHKEIWLRAVSRIILTMIHRPDVPSPETHATNTSHPDLKVWSTFLSQWHLTLKHLVPRPAQAGLLRSQRQYIQQERWADQAVLAGVLVPAGRLLLLL